MIIHTNYSDSSDPKTFLVEFELETNMNAIKSMGGISKVTDLNKDYSWNLTKY